MTPAAPPHDAPATVVCWSGLDPTGGAGIQADIEAIRALGGHAFALVTALTVQDTRDVHRGVGVAPDLLLAQFAALRADCAIHGFKIGLLADAAQVAAVATAIAGLDLPRVVDPVLRAGGGRELADEDHIAALRTLLLPGSTVITPNAAEARRLVPAAGTLDEAGTALVASGAANVLITGGDEPGATVVNTWYRRGSAPERFEWPRLPGSFHGAGCTLAASIAVLLAQGRHVREALLEAQGFTQRALESARWLGSGRAIPLRSRP